MMPYITKGWFRKGSKPVVRTVYGKGRISIFGAISENEFSAQMTEEKCNHETWLQFLKSLMRKFGKVLIVIDGAKNHFEKEHVQKFYEDKTGYGPTKKMDWKDINYIKEGIEAVM